MENIFDLSRSQLALRLEANGFKTFNASQIFSWLYQKNELDPIAWSNISKALKKYLNKKCVIIFDDIQDNLHFNDLSTEFEDDKIKVFKFNEKYIGMIWNL